MKKTLKLIVLFLVVMCVFGCKKESTLLSVCTFEAKDTDDKYAFNYRYEIYEKGGYVDKIISTQTISSDDENTLKYYKESFAEVYKEYSEEYGGYSYKITEETGKIVIKATIDYNEIDIEKYVESNPSLKEFIVKKNKIDARGRVSSFEAVGAICD